MPGLAGRGALAGGRVRGLEMSRLVSSLPRGSFSLETKVFLTLPQGFFPLEMTVLLTLPRESSLLVAIVALAQAVP